MITITIPFISANQPQAERLLDLIHWFGGATSCLLVAGPDVSQEMKLKTKLAAEVGFQAVDMLELPTVAGEENKIIQLNSIFRQSAQFVNDNYKNAWLWLEPTTVPLKDSWLEQIEDAYDHQPKRYMGAHMQGKTQKFLHKMAVYPFNALRDLDAPCQTPNPFYRVANTLDKSSYSKLFRIEQWAEGLKADAVLLDGDPSGKLVEQLIQSANKVFVGQNRLAKVLPKAKSAA